jgi:hypothetical protein
MFAFGRDALPGGTGGRDIGARRDIALTSLRSSSVATNCDQIRTTIADATIVLTGDQSGFDILKRFHTRRPQHKDEWPTGGDLGGGGSAQSGWCGA